MTNQIFVSYAHDNNTFIPVLKERLQDYFKLWVDETDLAGGKNWRDAIDEAIRGSFALLVIITPSSCKSNYVTYEWSFALGLDTPVIPIMLEKSDELIHPRLHALQYFDFSQRFKEPWNQLIDRLKVIQTEHPSAAATEAALRLLQLAKEQYDHNDLNNALDTLNEALLHARTTLLDDIYYERARVFLKLRDLDNAETNLTKVFQLNPVHVRALVASGDLYRMRADRAATPDETTLWLTKAEAQFRAALNQRDDLLDTSSESVWASLGGILKRKNNVDAAIDAYKKAARVKRSSYPYINLGLLYMQKNDLARIRENFGLVELFAQSKVNQNAGDEWAHNDLFMARLVLGNLDGARMSLSHIKIVAPSYAIESLRRTLDNLLMVQGLSDEVCAYIQQADKELVAQLAYLEQGG